jgi:hypothetical protein
MHSFAVIAKNDEHSRNIKHRLTIKITGVNALRDKILVTYNGHEKSEMNLKGLILYHISVVLHSWFTILTWKQGKSLRMNCSLQLSSTKIWI